MNAQEKFVREYCKVHGINCRIYTCGERKELRIWSPITKKYATAVFDILTKGINEIRTDIERHIAVFIP